MHTTDTSSEESYEIDDILDERLLRGRKEYFVHWKGYDDSDNSWVLAKNMSCPELLKKYKSRMREVSMNSTTSSAARESPTCSRLLPQRSSVRSTPIPTTELVSSSPNPATSNADTMMTSAEGANNPDGISEEFTILGKEDNPFKKNLTADSILSFILMGQKRFAAVVFKEEYTPYLIDVEICKEYIMNLVLTATLTVPTYTMVPAEKNEATDDQEEDAPMDTV